jgi:hypothetical protein
MATSSNSPASHATRQPTGSGWRAALRGLWSGPLLLASALFLVCLARALREALHGTEGRLIYALDDTYIHMAVARRLAELGVWGCTPFHFSSSSSSLLWTLVLGLAYRVAGVNDWTPLVLNVVFALATLAVADRALVRLGTAPLLRAVTLVGLVVAFPLPGIALLGMEHTLHLLLTIGFAAAAVATLTRPVADPMAGERWRTAGLCVLAALLAGSRYEGFFLVGLVCLAFLARRQPARAVAIGFAALVAVAAFGAYSVAHGWYFLPNPLMVKAVGEQSSTLSAILKPFGSEDLAFLKNNRAMPILLGLGLLAGIAEWRARRAPWRAPFLLALLLVGMLLLHGHFVFSPLYWAYRYDAYLVGFGLFVAAAVLGARVRRAALAALCVAVLVPVVADVREGLAPMLEIEGMRNTWLEEYQTAQLIRLYDPQETVIVNDLGAVTYYTDARVVDLVGLGDIEPVRIMRRAAYTSRDVSEWTASYRPKLAILQLDWSVVGPLVPPQWLRVALVEVPPHRKRVGFFAIDPAVAWRLRESVADHFGKLAPVLGYRVKLLPPEEMPHQPGTLADR